MRQRQPDQEQGQQQRSAQPARGADMLDSNERRAVEHDTQKRDGEPRRHEEGWGTGQEQNRPKRDKAPPDQPDEPNPSAYSEP